MNAWEVKSPIHRSGLSSNQSPKNWLIAWLKIFSQLGWNGGPKHDREMTTVFSLSSVNELSDVWLYALTGCHTLRVRWILPRYSYSNWLPEVSFTECHTTAHECPRHVVSYTQLVILTLQLRIWFLLHCQLMKLANLCIRPTVVF